MQIRQLKGQKQEDYLQMVAMETTSSLDMMLGLDQVIGDKGTILQIQPVEFSNELDIE